MHIGYLDEAGCPGALPHAHSDIQPLLVMGVLVLPQPSLAAVTSEFLRLKLAFNPKLRRSGDRWLDLTTCEIKGSDLRTDIRRTGRNRRRAVFGFLDKTLDLLEAHGARLLARIYVKGPGRPFRGKQVYTSSVQALCAGFQRFLCDVDSHGFLIADSRTPSLNANVSHSIFTQKYKIDGDAYSRILDLPTFGHSENHVPLQITDVLCSTVLWCMASSTYCLGEIRSVHVQPRDCAVRTRYASRIRALGYSYLDAGRLRGGVTVSDGIAQRGTSLMFQT